jgi:murein DD-endopeptidase MepM/ murein hydrolase activator NlpD
MTDNQIFEIVANSLAVYNAVGGTKIGAIPKGIKFTVVPGSRQESNGAIWWQHSAGWSIEKTVDGSTVFLQAVNAAPATTGTTTPAATPATPTTPDAATPSDTPETDEPAPAQNPLVGELVAEFQGFKSEANLRAKGSVKVRSEPGGNQTASLINGDIVVADVEALQKSGSYYWVKHPQGWSALQGLDGRQVFFEDAGDVYLPGPDGPKVEEMPGYQSLVVRHPVDLDQTNFFQYFGNNSFAYLYGRNFNYHGFAQGLHSGLDYGSNAGATGVKVYAGVHGTYKQTIYDAKGRGWNHQVRVETPDGHLLIYQHINPAKFTKGQEITPDTVVGTINGSFPSNGDHLHWEIRFNNQAWIVNPLAFMKPALVDEITAKFDPERPGTGASGSKYYYFYITDRWTKWGTPHDQPVIRRGGKTIDPRSEGF